MNIRKIVLGAFFCGFLMTVSADDAAAREPGWSWRVVATGDFREKIRVTPIEQRPYRPLHVYGNTVRRMHYRGTPLPVVRRPFVRR